MKLAQIASSDIIGEAIDNLGWFVDREARPQLHPRQDALDALPVLRQFSRGDRRLLMALDADMGCNQTNDALSFGRRKRDSGVCSPPAMPVEP